MALTEEQQRLLEASREAAGKLGSRGKVLTGLIGELSACEDKLLEWEPSDGYDAIVGELQVQVKTARSPTLGETMGWFGHKKKKGYLFDIAVYVELDNDFNVAGIWHMGVDEVKTLEDTETSTWGLRIDRFKECAEQLD